MLLLADRRPWCEPTSGGLLVELVRGSLIGYSVQPALGLLAPVPLELVPAPLELALAPLELVRG